MLLNQAAAVNGNHCPFSEGALYDFQCPGIGRIGIDRHQNRLVYDQKVGVSCRQTCPIFIVAGLRPGQFKQLVRLSMPIAERLELSMHLCQRVKVVIQSIVAALKDDGVVRCQPGQGVDVAVGIIPQQAAMIEP